MARKSDIAPPPGPSPFARGPTGMSGAITLVLGLTLLGLLFARSLAAPALERAVHFERGPESVARVFERRLELAAALAELPHWESSALAPFVPVDAHTSEAATAAFAASIEVGHLGREKVSPEEKAARELELDGLRARRALLLAEAGRIEEAQGDLDDLADNGHADFVVAVRAYPSGRADTASFALAGDGWIGRRATARASGAAPPRPGGAALAALTWARGLAGSVAIGLLVLLAWLARNRPESVVGTLAIPSPWSPQTGFGVLVRAAFLAELIGLAIDALSTTTGTDVPTAFVHAAAAVPLVWLARKHLARPNRLALPEIAGLPARARTAVIATLALFALQQIGGRALATAASSSGAIDPWTSNVDELFLWGGDTTWLVSTLDRVVFGVLALELAFRSVLFPSLRHVHGPIHAALLTGLLFSAVHLASLPAMLALSWSGFVLALSVERTRSLLPALACMWLGELLERGLLGALYR